MKPANRILFLVTSIVVLQDPKFDGNTVTPVGYERFWDQSVEQYGIVFGTDNPDLTAFRDRGGKAPETLLATRRDQAGAVTRSRPLCQYPQVAKYKGSGSTDDAANVTCGNGF